MKATRSARVHFASCEIEFSARRAVQPDLFVTSLVDGRMSDDSLLRGTILLAVEVLSPTTARYDGRK